MQLSTGKLSCALKVIVYGPEGIGKSTFAARFPNPVFIDTEGSTKHMDVTRTPKPSSWAMLLQQVEHFKQHPDQCGTLVIDTADWAEQLCVRQICSTAQVDGLEGFGFGKGYTYLAEEFTKLLQLLEEVVEQGVHVVLTAHAQMRKFEEPAEMGAYDRWELKLQKKTAPLVKEWADMVLFANYKTYVVNVDNQGAQKGKNKAQGGHRVMYTTHHPCWDAKNRQGLKEELPFDFKEIAHCFGTLRQQPAAPSEEITPEDKRLAEDFQKRAEQRDQEARKAAADPAPPPEETPMEQMNLPGEWPPPGSDLDGVPKELRDLMEADHVLESEIREAVAKRGYFPGDTPIANYPPDFVQGVLIGAWKQVLDIIVNEIRDLPF